MVSHLQLAAPVGRSLASRQAIAVAWRPAPAPSQRHHRRCRQHLPLPCAATSSTDGDDEGPCPLSSGSDAERLNRLLQGGKPMTGEELRQLVVDKWGCSYDVTLQRRGKRMYLHVMWRFLEQQSFPMTEEEYMLQLDAVASYLNLWEVSERVRAGIAEARRRPGYTAGGSARAISIPLDVDVGGEGRSGEWNVF